MDKAQVIQWYSSLEPNERFDFKEELQRLDLNRQKQEFKERDKQVRQSYKEVTILEKVPTSIEGVTAPVHVRLVNQHSIEFEAKRIERKRQVLGQGSHFWRVWFTARPKDKIDTESSRLITVMKTLADVGAVPC